MSKTFDSFQKSTIKNAAKAVAHFQAKKDKLVAQIQELESIIKTLDNDIKCYEVAVENIAEGYKPQDLCEKVSRGSKNDWVFKYPDTILPPTSESTSTEDEEFHEPVVEPLSNEYSEIEESEEFEEETREENNEDPIDNIFN